jgi:molybdopterin synthase catalytic subunit
MSADWIEILDQPINLALVIQFVTDENAGGIALFLGTTRAETSSTGQSLKALDYTAYTAMARQQLAGFAQTAHEKWPVLRLALLHRTGRVGLGEPSVVVAVASPHRADAFEACRWLIDTLKAEVAIWKKEIWADGGETWIHPDKPI